MNSTQMRITALVAAIGLLAGGNVLAQDSGASGDKAQQQSSQNMEQSGKATSESGATSTGGMSKQQGTSSTSSGQSAESGGTQTSDKAKPAETAKAGSGMSEATIEVGKLMDASVTNKNGEEIGSIDNLLMTREGQLQKAVISVGGFLGMGDRQVALSLDELDIQTAKQGKELAVHYNGTTSELESMPAYEPKKKAEASGSGQSGSGQSGSGSGSSGSGGQNQQQTQ